MLLYQKHYKYTLMKNYNCPCFKIFSFLELKKNATIYIQIYGFLLIIAFAFLPPFFFEITGSDRCTV